jgi:hypothetical protein
MRHVKAVHREKCIENYPFFVGAKIILELLSAKNYGEENIFKESTKG